MTYVLGLAVLVVWGMIIYRIFAAVNANDDDSATPMVNPVKEAYNDFSIPKDTTHLLLNYRDPFGLVRQKDTARFIPSRISTRTPVLGVKPMDWSFIRYSGYMLNPATKKLIALVSVNGQNITLSEGQTKNEVKLIKNLQYFLA